MPLTEASHHRWFRSVRFRMALIYTLSVAIVSGIVLSAVYAVELQGEEQHVCATFVAEGQQHCFIAYHLGQIRERLLLAWVCLVLAAAVVGYGFAPLIMRAAEEAMEAISRSADAIAHDLRAPLTRLKLRAEMMATRKGAECDFAPEVVADTDAMLSLVNTLLEIARLERSGQEALDVVDLSEVARQVTELYEPVAESAGVAFALSTAGPVPVRGERARLRQAVGNLVDNAIKYTPAGGQVEVKVTSAGVLSVKDTGIGIPAEAQPHIFEKFYRAGNANASGEGLGLALVAAIVTACGGHIAVSSAPGGGSVFAVQFRLTAGT